MPLPVNLDPLESKNLIRHLNGTNKERLNNLNYKKLSLVLKVILFKKN